MHLIGHRFGPCAVAGCAESGAGSVNAVHAPSGGGRPESYDLGTDKNPCIDILQMRI